MSLYVGRSGLVGQTIKQSSIDHVFVDAERGSIFLNVIHLVSSLVS